MEVGDAGEGAEDGRLHPAATRRRGTTPSRWRWTTPRFRTRASGTRRCCAATCAKYDWLHLHHEDFTGQYGKFWAAYHTMPAGTSRRRRCRRRWPPSWLRQGRRSSRARSPRRSATTSGAAASCSACARRTDTYDIALAAAGRGHRRRRLRRRPARPGRAAQARLLAHARVPRLPPRGRTRSPTSSPTSTARRRPTSAAPTRLFTLFDFTAKNDPVPTMLTQDHVNAVPEFLGPEHGLPPRHAQARRDRARRGRGHRRGEVRARPVRARHVHVPRRPRPRGLPAHGGRPARPSWTSSRTRRATG